MKTMSKKHEPYPVAIFTQADGEPIYLIGSAYPPLGVITESLDDLWAAWRSETPDPDNDSHFVDWLVSERGWKSNMNVDYHIINV